MSNQQNDIFNEHQREIAEMNLDNLLSALKTTRQQSTYISLEEIVKTIKVAFPEEYKLIGEKLTN